MAVKKQINSGFVGQSVTFDSVVFYTSLFHNPQIQHFTYKQEVFS
jgi:hypothetical protein